VNNFAEHFIPTPIDSGVESDVLLSIPFIKGWDVIELVNHKTIFMDLTAECAY